MLRFWYPFLHTKYSILVYYSMDLAEKLWLDCDVEGALREINAILARESQSNSDINQTLLFSAYMHFQLGKLHKSHELLNKGGIFNFLYKWINHRT